MSLQTVIKSVRTPLLLTLLVAMACGTFRVPSVHAEDLADRKIKSRVAPAYPEIARRLGLTGVVKLQLVIAANGNVKETKVIGGHPILVNAAVDAVKKWRFESASSESTGNVEFKFDPGN